MSVTSIKRIINGNKTMTTEEAIIVKIEAENEIIDTLNKLEQSTGCLSTSIELINYMEEGFGNNEILVKKKVNIRLEIK